MIRVLAASLVLFASAPFARAADEAPHWIWPGEAKPAEAGKASPTHLLRRTFELTHATPTATLKVAADFCRATVTLNGQVLTVVEPYSQTVEVDAMRAIKLGQNELTVEVGAVPGPSAIALTLRYSDAEGKPAAIQSDESWLLGDEQQPGKIASSGRVAPELWGIGRRSIAVDSFENYEQWRQSISSDKSQAKPPRFWLAPGFEIQTLRTAGPDEGSWIAMAFDPQGRLTVSREDQGLLRFTLDAAKTKVERVETINKDLLECRGLVYADGVLYANANNSKGLYELKDADGDGQFEKVTLLRQFPGGVGHGRNDIVVDPIKLRGDPVQEPWLLAINGDSVSISDAEADFDFTSRLREVHRGEKTSEGWLHISAGHPRKWVVAAAGLRNPYGIAVNQDKVPFTYDADAEHDMGTPWYRPTRIVQLVIGADYGWRGVTGKWPPYYPDHPDNCPPTLDIGRGSPTAVLFGTGAKFPTAYQRAFFVLDWAYGRVLAVHLAPRGAGYRAGAETFLQGRPLNVTDLATGPDGAMYLLTGGRKTQSSLYRVSYSGTVAATDKDSVHESACQTHATTARLYWGELMPYRTPRVSRTAPELGDPDPIVAYDRRLGLERWKASEWQSHALAEVDTAVLLNAGLALARVRDKSVTGKLLDRVAGIQTSDLPVSQFLSLLHIYSLCREHAPDEVASRKAKIVAQLDPLFPLPPKLAVAVSPVGTGVQAQRELAKLLVELEAPEIVDRVAKTLLASPVQEDRIQGLLVLRHVRTGWTPTTRRAYFETLRDGANFVAGEGMPKFLAHFREEATATLTEAEKQELGDLLKPQAAAEEEALPPARPLVQAWTLDDLKSLWADNERQGDAARGMAIFRDALCVRCHRAGARGPAVGPDLTFVAGRFSRRDLLASLLTPSQVVAENYRNVEVSTTDGRVLRGRVVVGGDYRSETLRLATDPLHPTKVVELSKREIESSRESPTSPMPEGLLNTLKLEEILDLLAFLEKGGH